MIRIELSDAQHDMLATMEKDIRELMAKRDSLVEFSLLGAVTPEEMAAALQENRVKVEGKTLVVQDPEPPPTP